MQNIPSGYVSLQPAAAIPKKERGAFLTVVLAFQTIAAIWATFIVVIGGAKVDEVTQGDASMHDLHHVASRVIFAAAVFEIMKLASLMGMWAWKRWALFLYFASSTLGLFAVYKITGSLSYWEIAAMAFMFIGTFPRITMFED